MDELNWNIYMILEHIILLFFSCLPRRIRWLSMLPDVAKGMQGFKMVQKDMRKMRKWYVNSAKIKQKEQMDKIIHL